MPFFDFLQDDKTKAVVKEMRDFVKNEVSVELLKAMDREEIKYPREFVKKLGERNLLGIRFPKKWGGRGMSCTAEVAMGEEIAVVGCGLSVTHGLPSIVGEAINTFGTDDQKQKYLRPMLKGEIQNREAGLIFLEPQPRLCRKGITLS